MRRTRMTLHCRFTSR
uniref:Uncharacterized protein n=1 Tax=Anguilla anguilla TaxID=7936 RepID=A0A0E9XPN6_ANGAN